MGSSSPIRPTGSIQWLLPKLDLASRWTILGTISAEERWMTAATECQKLAINSDVRFLRIPPSRTSGRVDWVVETNRRIAAHSKVALSSFGASSVPYDSVPDALDHDIIELSVSIANDCSPNVVLDVSTMPKRFFFPILTRLCQHTQIQTLVVTNTTPIEYAKELAADAEEWRSLPIYCGENFEATDEITLIIGVGYHPFRIQEILERSRSQRLRIKLILPFPSLHPGWIDNWKFVQSIVHEWSTATAPIPVVRVPVQDVSLAFDALRQHSQDGRSPAVIMAPFGPKALSVAMSLLGVARGLQGLPTEIGYTQPQRYNPDYSKGIATEDRIPRVTGFCVRLNGRNLYSL
jgi:hypothetical protein